MLQKFYFVKWPTKTQSTRETGTVECRLLYEPAPGISTNLDFLSFAKFYANSDFTSIILEVSKILKISFPV